METVSKTTDALLDYLQSTEHYYIPDLLLLLTAETVITKEHISSMKYSDFDIIKIFKTHGYVFMNDDYLILVKKNVRFLEWIPQFKKTYEFYKLAVQMDGLLLQCVPTEFQTEELCDMAVKNNQAAFKFVPKLLILNVMSFKNTRYASKFTPKYLIACIENVYPTKDTDYFNTDYFMELMDKK